MKRKEEIKTKKGLNYRRDFEKLSGDVKSRYEEKIRLCGGIDPYSIKENDLSLASTDFPRVSVSDIADYMINTTSPYTKQAFSAYKSTEAFKFFESGFVLSIGSKNNVDSSILKGRVKHSQKMNEAPVYAWVLVEMKGRIICAHCTCTAGLSETCSHVGAICFAVASLSESTEIKSVTDELCKWNVPSSKEVSMSGAANIQWKMNSKEQRTTQSNFRLYCDSISHLSDERIIQFIETCHADGDITALETIIFPEKIIRKTNIRDVVFLGSLFNEAYRTKGHDELVEIGKAILLNITNEEVKEISSRTLPHLKSVCSVGLRRGRITGSQFKKCCLASINTPPITTILQLIKPTKLDDVPSVKYQNKNKKIALQQYKSIAMCEHEDFTHNVCGLIINPRVPYFAGSNDGILSCTCHGNGCLEIKCLKILESSPSFEVLTKKPNNMLNKQGDLYVLETTHELFYQVQLQINLISLNYCDLVLWSPSELLLITVEADMSFWKTSMARALTFHEQVIMPELLGKFYTSTDPMKNEIEKEKLIELEIEILCPNEKDEAIEHEVEEPIELEILRPEVIALKVKAFSENEKHKAVKLRSIKSEKCASNEPINTHESNSVRNLMKHSVNDILLTFFEHEDKLKQLYDEHIRELRRNYKAKDLPDLVAFDIVNEKQFQEMAIFAESKLSNLDEEHNSSDVIFDCIIQEWAILAFCKEFNLSRNEAVETLALQSQKLIEMSTEEVVLSDDPKTVNFR